MNDAERRLFVISGCSGGGKSTLLKALAKRGHRIVEEPGRRIVHREQEHGGNALPWIDMKAFAQAAISMALNNLERLPAYGLIFFDRGLIDAASALRSVTGDRFLETLKYDHRYSKQVFFTPPWPEIYFNDRQRQHGFEQAVKEYERLLRDYKELDYEAVILPKTRVENLVQFILDAIGSV